MENGQRVYLIVSSQTGKVLERERVYVSLKHANTRLEYWRRWRRGENAKVVEYKPVPEDHERLESQEIIKEDFTEVVNAEVSLQPIIGVEQLARLIKGCDSNGN